MPKFAANLTMLYNEVEFLDRFGAAARAGFKGVEYLFPYQYPKDNWPRRLKDTLVAGYHAGMRIVDDVYVADATQE